MRVVLTLPISLLLAVGACGKSSAPPGGEAQAAPTTSTTTAATAPAGGGADKAKEIYSQRCVPCHGPSGAGDGAASASLNPKPRDFTSPEWQASVTDDHIQQIIKLGGAAVGKSPAMPNNPDLMNDAATVTALKDIIRGFKK